MKKPVEYNTGWKRLDNFLTAVAYGVAILGFFVVAAGLSALLWLHWRIYG